MTEPTLERHFEVIHDKLDRLDEAIRGNGKPGILIRLDRLEQDAKRQGKLVWLIVGATVVAAVSTLVQWIAG
ncbi:MAG: hypothetical protein GX591_00400 [Planctomycetes bacterium]|nr:hypothetical protein [Planctomycetota bacterium]